MTRFATFEDFELTDFFECLPLEKGDDEEDFGDCTYLVEHGEVALEFSADISSQKVSVLLRLGERELLNLHFPLVSHLFYRRGDSRSLRMLSANDAVVTIMLPEIRVLVRELAE